MESEAHSGRQSAAGPEEGCLPEAAPQPEAVDGAQDSSAWQAEREGEADGLGESEQPWGTAEGGAPADILVVEPPPAEGSGYALDDLCADDEWLAAAAGSGGITGGQEQGAGGEQGEAEAEEGQEGQEGEEAAEDGQWDDSEGGEQQQAEWEEEEEGSQLGEPATLQPLPLSAAKGDSASASTGKAAGVQLSGGGGGGAIKTHRPSASTSGVAQASPSSSAAGGEPSVISIKAPILRSGGKPRPSGGAASISSGASASTSGGGKRLTFTAPPKCLERRPRAVIRSNFSHSQQRVRQILRDNDKLVKRLGEIAYSRPEYEKSQEKHDKFLAKSAASSAARRRTEASRVMAQNLRIYQRLQEVRPSRDVERGQQEKDFAKHQAVLAALAALKVNGKPRPVWAK